MIESRSGINYFIDCKLYWGSDSLDVLSFGKDALNTAPLSMENIVRLELVSSLSSPFFRGSLVYSDMRQDSMFRNLVSMPAVYGQLVFNRVAGGDLPGGDNVPEPQEGESFAEDVFITGIDMVDRTADRVGVKLDFVSVDYLNFISNMRNVSTFAGDRSTKPLKELLGEMFAAVGLGDRFDAESVTMDVEIPYVSSENDTLLTALDYVYRKIFDHDFGQRNGKSYCRVVYDYDTRKYVLWRFDDSFTEKAVDSKIKDTVAKAAREVVSVDASKGNIGCNIDGSACMKSSGSRSLMFETLDNVKFVDYDYLSNAFSDGLAEGNGDAFMPHPDEFDPDSVSNGTIVMGNSRLLKDAFYERTFTTSRQNGSVYDIFTEILFNTSFVRSKGDASIGRHAGETVLLSYQTPLHTIYEHMSGSYLVTAVRTVYERTPPGCAVTSEMDLYSPYFAADSTKERTII